MHSSPVALRTIPIALSIACPCLLSRSIFPILAIVDGTTSSSIPAARTSLTRTRHITQPDKHHTARNATVLRVLVLPRNMIAPKNPPQELVPANECRSSRLQYRHGWSMRDFSKPVMALSSTLASWILNLAMTVCLSQYP